MRFLCDGKRVLIGLARHAAATDLQIARLVEKWDALTPGAQKAVTLTDLCKFCNVTPDRFIAATARAGCEIDNHSVIIALSCIDVPRDVQFAVKEEFERRNAFNKRIPSEVG